MLFALIVRGKIVIDYYLSTNISLSLEDYYNDGLTPEEAKEVIENISDTQCGGWPSHLSCRPSGINRNWTVRTLLMHPQDIRDIVIGIQVALDSYMDDKRGQPKCVKNA